MDKGHAILLKKIKKNHRIRQSYIRRFEVHRFKVCSKIFILFSVLILSAVLSGCSGGSSNSSSGKDSNTPPPNNPPPSEPPPSETPSPTVTAPEALQSLTATSGDTKVLLSWQAPAENGGAPITHYQYRVSSDDGNTWSPDWTNVPDGFDTNDLPGDENLYPVTGLINFIGYTFEVRATNSQGGGEALAVTRTPLVQACESPNLEGRIQVWRGALNVGVSSQAPLYGFIGSNPMVGQLSERNFTVASNNYTIDQLTLSGGTSSRQFLISFNRNLTSEEKSSLRLHICDEELNFNQSNGPSTDHSYGWSLSSLDWSLSNTRHLRLSIPDNTAPVLVATDGITVDGSSLVLSYSEDLDASSIPAASAFSISLNGEAGVSPSFVTINGQRVTLTLSTPVSGIHSVALSYTAPLSNPIQDTNGNDASSFASQPVTNNTELPKVSITPLHPQATPFLAHPEFEVTLDQTLPERITVRIEIIQDENYLSHTLQTISIPANQTSATAKFESQYNGSISGPLTARVLASVNYTSAASPQHEATVQMIAANPALTLSWQQNAHSIEEGELLSTSVVARTAPNIPQPRENIQYSIQTEGGTAQPNTDYTFSPFTQTITPSDWQTEGSIFSHSQAVNIQSVENSTYDTPSRSLFAVLSKTPIFPENVLIAPCPSEQQGANGSCKNPITITEDETLTVTDVAVTSTPSSGGTYNLNNIIQFTVTFNGSVTVTGSPQLNFEVGEAGSTEIRSATYSSGTNSSSLVFSYTVSDGDNDSDGLSWGANILSLNGGNIRFTTSDSSLVVEAALVHPSQAPLPEHKIDSPPTLNLAQVEDTSLTLTYNETLDTNSVPANNSFFISVDSISSHPIATAIVDSKVTLTLAKSVYLGQVVTVTYIKPPSEPLQDVSGLEASEFSNQPVENPNGPPSAPQSVQFAGESGQVTLSWDAPMYTGGLLTNHYQYRVSADNGNTWIPDWTSVPDSLDAGDSLSDERSHTITGLTNDVEYTFELRAVNNEGGGLVARLAATPSIVAAPENFQFTVTPQTLTFTWGVESNKPSPHHYVLMRSTDNSTNFQRVSGADNIQGVTTYPLSITTYRFDWAQTRYKLLSCTETESTCYDSNEARLSAADSIPAINYIKPPDPSAGDHFGYALSLDQDTLAVGAPNYDSDSDSNIGTVYIFVRSSNTWTLQSQLTASNAGETDKFGFSVSLDGDTLAVGAPEEDSNANASNASGAGNSGAVYVFVRSGTSWTQQAMLKASNAGANDKFGYSVSLDGDSLAVGAHLEDNKASGVNPNKDDEESTNSGAAYVFVRSGTTWTEQAYIKAPSTDANSEFGTSISIHGNFLAVGAPQEGSNDRGAVYAYKRSSTTWTVTTEHPIPSLREANQNFGQSLVIHGSYIYIGAPGDRIRGAGAGAVHYFVYDPDEDYWLGAGTLYAIDSAGTAGDAFGSTVSTDGSNLVVGAPSEQSNSRGVSSNRNNNSSTKAGAVYVFRKSGSRWKRTNYIKASNTGANDNFGAAVSVDGNTLTVGAYGEDSDTSEINGDDSDNSISAAGAVYAY